MRLQARRLRTLLLGLFVLLPLALPATGEPAQEAVRIAHADEVPEGGTGKLEARYAPRQPEEKSWYNSDYIFGMTRGLTGSTLHPAAKVPLLVLTIPLDLALLPFAAIGGLFG